MQSILMARLSLIILGFVCLLSACGQQTAFPGIDTPEKGSITSVQTKADVMKFIKHEVVDRQGVERYSDGQSQVSLPSGYSGAWVNDKGEYLLSNTQGFDPNTQMNGAWKALQKN